MVPAGCYGAVLHYLKAVADMGVAAAKAGGVEAVEPDEGDAGRRRLLRQEHDPRPTAASIHPAYLFEVKTPAESGNPWDFYKLLATTPGEEAFRPLAEGGCPLVAAA